MKKTEQNTQKHTPGPWQVDGNYIHGTNGKRFLADAGDGEGLTNARIISAAPELLDALRMASVLLWKNSGRLISPNRADIDEAFEAMRNAIAKATGEGKQ